jgi:hypothetical protein
MRAPIIDANVTAEEWDEVRRHFVNQVGPDVCNSRSLTERILGPRPSEPAPEFRVDRSDGYGARVTCLAGDRVHVEFAGSDLRPGELRARDAIELGEALIAAGRYFQAHS